MGKSLISWLWAGLVLSLVACGGSPPPPTSEAAPTPTATGAAPSPTSEPVLVRVIMREFSIESSLSNFSVGTIYRFSITNRGELAHQFVLESEGALDKPLRVGEKEAKVGDDRLLPRTTLTFEWTFTETGDFQIACHAPGHYGQGMVLPIVVQ